MILFHLIISAIILWIFLKFTRTIEIKEYGGWKPFVLPVYAWGLVLLAALTPVFNIVGLLIFIGFCVSDSKSHWATTRFKENNVINNFINKIVNLLTKEF